MTSLLIGREPAKIDFYQRGKQFSLDKNFNDPETENFFVYFLLAASFCHPKNVQ